MRVNEIIRECQRRGCCPLALAMKERGIPTGNFPSVWAAAEKLDITLKQAVDIASYWGPKHSVCIRTAAENAHTAGLFPDHERFVIDAQIPFNVGDKVYIAKGAEIATPTGTMVVKAERRITVRDVSNLRVVWNTCRGQFSADANDVYSCSSLG